jgi:methionine-rich copper-binding protein CopC
MRTKKNSILAIALSFLFCAAFLIVGGETTWLHASIVAPSPAQNQAPDESPVNTFNGKIMSQNGVRFILRDDSNDTWYHLDDQQQASKYLGKVVQVTGTLDGRTDTIRVRNIAEAKS